LTVDTSGTRARDEGYNEPDQPGDFRGPRLPHGFYAIAYSPPDKAIWGSNLRTPVTCASIRQGKV
jgi:hypothetical protein